MELSDIYLTPLTVGILDSLHQVFYSIAERVAGIINIPALIDVLIFLQYAILAGVCLIILRIIWGGAEQIFGAQIDNIKSAFRGGPKSGGADGALSHKEIKKLIAERRFEEAGHTYLAMEEPARAAEMFMRAGNSLEAARAYEQTGAKKRAATMYQKAGSYSQAATLYEKIGETKGAAVMYAKAGLFKQAADLFAGLGDYLNAAKLYERCMIDESASSSSSVARENPYISISAQMFEKAGQPKKSADIYVKSGNYQKAGEIYERAGAFAEAARAYADGGLHELAASAYQKAGDEKSSLKHRSQLALKHGDSLEAAELAAESGDYSQAAEIYLRLGKTTEAAQAYIKAGFFMEAGELYMSMGKHKQAAEAYEKAESFTYAAQALEADGTNPLGSAVLYEQAGEYVKAAEKFKQVGHIDKAIDALQKLVPAAPDYYIGSKLLAECFLAKEMPKQALQRLQALSASSPLSLDSLDMYYLIGLAQEKLGRNRQARETYEKILALDYSYQDVEQRMKKIPDEGSAGSADSTAKGGAIPGFAGKRYDLIKEVGRGGMGRVYQARDTMLDRMVAYKRIAMEMSSTSEQAKSMLNEARISASLNHRNIVAIYDIGMDEEGFYIIMEFIEGTTLKHYVKNKGPFTPKQTIMIAKQILRALSYAHSKNVVHRDIKPANMMFGSDRVIKLMDFGIAKLVEKQTMQSTGIKGTPLYMAPEQILGKGVDKRADIYAVGATLFELAAGKPPFFQGDIYYHHLHTRPPLVSSLAPDCPPLLDNIIGSCLVKDMKKRYQSAEEVLKDLDTYEG